VVHESDLPKGRGFAPVAWQVLEGQTVIPVVLFEAVSDIDAGPIYLRDEIRLSGFELNDEIRRLQGDATVAICVRFLEQYPNVVPQPQTGSATVYRRRTARDSELDPDKTLREQFDLLRTVDNERHPAYFELGGHRYLVRILPWPDKP
jgi:methionyl-tRNA formyltransferase